ncbi:unnamed protein product [Lactuca virosa]|uniref:Uncharacterized protein n=1 Tax=Lactuca virosa TaxID=75947 RepID=A0AAU9N041_9ASTR|nr:unnamed protein product [Lactuca virosa]
MLLHRKSMNLAELALIQCLSPSRVPGYAGNPLKDGGGRLRTAGSRGSIQCLARSSSNVRLVQSCSMMAESMPSGFLECKGSKSQFKGSNPDILCLRNVFVDDMLAENKLICQYKT